MVQADVAGDPAALLATFHDEDYRNRPVDLTMVLFESAPGDLVLALPLLSGVVTGAPRRVGLGPHQSEASPFTVSTT